MTRAASHSASPASYVRRCTNAGIRDDKTPDMSTTPDQVASMYRAQAMASQSKPKDDEDEFW